MVGARKIYKAKLEGAIPTRAAKARGLLSFRGVVCLLLGFMVFAWGTNYRLSLYKAERESSPAKVSTRGSDSAKRALDNAADHSTAAHTQFSAAVLFSLRQGSEYRALDRLSDDAVADLSPLSRAPILYLRPPPNERRSLV
jgi:hypothetical protein